jgi:hypothetical protein
MPLEPLNLLCLSFPPSYKFQWSPDFKNKTIKIFQGSRSILPGFCSGSEATVLSLFSNQQDMGTE